MLRGTNIPHLCWPGLLHHVAAKAPETSAAAEGVKWKEWSTAVGELCSWKHLGTTSAHSTSLWLRTQERLWTYSKWVIASSAEYLLLGKKMNVSTWTLGFQRISVLWSYVATFFGLCRGRTHQNPWCHQNWHCVFPSGLIHRINLYRKENLFLPATNTVPFFLLVKLSLHFFWGCRESNNELIGTGFHYSFVRKLEFLHEVLLSSPSWSLPLKRSLLSHSCGGLIMWENRSTMERGKAKTYFYSCPKQEMSRCVPKWNPGYLACCNAMPIKKPFFYLKK